METIMATKYLTTENIDGYTADQLTELNIRIHGEVTSDGVATDDLAYKSVVDHITARVLAEFDAE
jgi:hypothetical protein